MLPSQMLKGILEGCILVIINENETYGYELSMQLQQFGLNISEGSIYPLLLRLQKEGVIKGEMKPSQSGPNRKYYHVTDKGKEALIEFKKNWENMKKPVDRILDWGQI